MLAQRVSAAQMVRVAYDISLDVDAWVKQALELFRGSMDDGFGVYGGIAQRTPPAVFQMNLAGAHPVNRMLTSLGMRVGFFDRVPEGYFMASSREILGPEVNRRLTSPFSDMLPAVDHVGISVSDGAGLVMFLASPRRSFDFPLRGVDRLARRVLPHFGQGLRLRRCLSGRELDAPSAEGLFNPDGGCEHAQGMAESRDARRTLREAVRRLGVERRPAPSEEGSRPELLSGRWSLVDRFDSDGRRFVVAYRNPRGVLDPRRLSERERDVAARIALGKSQKCVASELGIRVSTVARVAANVTQKLGLRSTRELPLFWRCTGGRAVALGASNLLVFSQPDRTPGQLEVTPAEQEVLDLIVGGKSNREIALLRRTSVRTVANQVASLLGKLQADSRWELASQALNE